MFNVHFGEVDVFRGAQFAQPHMPESWTYYRMDNGFQNGAYSFLCKLLSGPGQPEGNIKERYASA